MNPKQMKKWPAPTETVEVVAKVEITDTGKSFVGNLPGVGWKDIATKDPVFVEKLTTPQPPKPELTTTVEWYDPREQLPAPGSPILFVISFFSGDNDLVMGQYWGTEKGFKDLDSAALYSGRLGHTFFNIDEVLLWAALPAIPEVNDKP